MKNKERDMNANELNEFKITLSEMKSRIEANIARLREELEGVATDEGINDMEDLASLESESMHHNALLAQQQRGLAEVLHALSKIAEGRYGICEESGDPIPVERLRAEPHARYCIRDAEKHEL